MIMQGQAVLVASSLFRLALTLVFTAITAIGTLASILGVMTWIIFALNAPEVHLVSFLALMPLLTCLCVRNLQILSENWNEMSWRPLIEVGIITIASLLALWVVKTLVGWAW